MLWAVFPVVFVLLLAVLSLLNARSDRRFVASGGECTACYDEGSSNPLSVRCDKCGRWQKGYEPQNTAS